MKENSEFIRRLYFRALFPNVIAVLGGTVNVFFDGIFIGRKLGDIGLESVNQCLPVYLLLCTIGALYASGALCLSAHAVGENDAEKGTRFFQGALLDALLVGFVFCLAGFCLSGQLAALLGTASSYEYVRLYLRITLAGGVAKILLYLPYFYLRLEGKNRHAMTAMLTMTFLNIVLDYCFLFVWDFGIRGAAWASDGYGGRHELCVSFCGKRQFPSGFPGASHVRTRGGFPVRQPDGGEQCFISGPDSGPESDSGLHGHTGACVRFCNRQQPE